MATNLNRIQVTVVAANGSVLDVSEKRFVSGIEGINPMRVTIERERGGWVQANSITHQDYGELWITETPDELLRLLEFTRLGERCGTGGAGEGITPETLIKTVTEEDFTEEQDVNEPLMTLTVPEVEGATLLGEILIDHVPEGMAVFSAADGTFDFTARGGVMLGAKITQLYIPGTPTTPTP
jgi:hypothetical protein